jgi:hypothetical protein
MMVNGQHVHSIALCHRTIACDKLRLSSFDSLAFLPMLLEPVITTGFLPKGSMTIALL